MSKTGQVAAGATRNRPGRRRILAAAVAAAFPMAAWAQGQPQQLERVEITGSAASALATRRASALAPPSWPLSKLTA